MTTLPEPSKPERAAIRRATRRAAKREPRFAMKVLQQGEGEISVSKPHSDTAGWSARLHDTFGTTSDAFVQESYTLMTKAMRAAGSTLSESATNAALATLSGLGPTNEIEAMLAMQMVATNSLAMNLIGTAARVDNPEIVLASGALAAKLLRAFAMQADTLSRMRRGGEQTVRVEHVHVHAGGQAIVGNVATRRGQGSSKKLEAQSHGHRGPDELTPLLGVDTAGHVLPMPGDGEREVSHTRRDQPRCADR